MLATLTDITNVQATVLPPQKVKIVALNVAPAVQAVAKPTVAQHNPYKWKCLPAGTHSAADAMADQEAAYAMPVQELFQEKEDRAPPAPCGPLVCNTLVQFKCHQAEFLSSMVVDKGQYVVVQGDRGIDIGVVIRINTTSQKTYVECTGPVGSILRHATQREVDYWATDLKDAEAIAAAFCQAKVRSHGLPMEIAYAEYQFDKKKLTFYYEARTRIDFVQLLKELYREYGCRIWMEKLRSHE
ncbi:putative PSP1 C-terminal conserved region containing protein [Leishmania utingensis]|uniref:PSP1 C-terminal conserved region containing protein n=1 Tax=Leishmania utingensis TaxID=653362 RepID=A0AAW2ZW66_9TRYP